jgi:hypothetical protein
MTKSARCVNRSRRSQFWRLNPLGLLIVSAFAFFWWGGAELMQRIQQNQSEELAGRSAPPGNYPQPSQAVVNNNKTAALQLAPNLEGAAVIYPKEVDALVSADGRFRTDLSLGELARLLRVDPQTIAKRPSTAEIDPEAVLFTVAVGRLSANAKAQARRTREVQARMGIHPSAVGDEWTQTKLSFSLSALLRPNEDQRLVLDAILGSALHLPREPGAKINAVPLMYDRPDEQPTFDGGFLPLEPQQQCSISQ